MKTLCLQMNEPALLSTKLSAQVGRCLKWRIARCYDADALLKVLPHKPLPQSITVLNQYSALLSYAAVGCNKNTRYSSALL